MVKMRMFHNRKDRSKLRKKWEKLVDKIQYTYWGIVPYDYRPHELIYKFKCWAWRRHTTVKPRYLPHTWIDRSGILPHMMFEILSQFIEEECSPGHIDWEGSGHKVTVNGEEVNVRKEMQDIYDWWHNEYNGTYPKEVDAAWEEAFKHQPIHHDIAIDADGNEVEDEDDADYFEWRHEFTSEGQEDRWHAAMDRVHEIQRTQEDKLEEMMHRLVKLTPYLWT